MVKMYLFVMDPQFDQIALIPSSDPDESNVYAHTVIV